jgi:predicted alpha/beta superfamily hydrolase
MNSTLSGEAVLDRAELPLRPTEFLPPVETHLVRSTCVAQTFKVQVMRPVRKEGEATRFPVVYATDGNLTFDMLKGIAYLMQGSARDTPRFILVSIGYPGDSPAAGSLLRARDLLFPGYPRLSLQRATDVAGVLRAPSGSPDFGHASDFQSFLETELFPLIDTTYESVPGAQTYFGHSAGGGFGLFTLFTAAHLFKNYIISSPGLAFHGRSSAGVNYDHYEFMLERARTFVASGQSLPNVQLYLSVGSQEEQEPALAAWRLSSSVERFAQYLRAAAIPGLTFMSEVLAGETHATAWPIAFIHGVQAVFHSEAWNARAR